MTSNTTLTSTAVARQLDGGLWTIKSPLAGFLAQDKNKKLALTKYVEMIGAYMYAQQRQAEIHKKPGRPAKNYDAHLHIQVPKAVKERFDAVADEYDLSQSETIVFLLDCLVMLKEDFVNPEDMKEAENSVLRQFAGAR